MKMIPFPVNSGKRSGLFCLALLLLLAGGCAPKPETSHTVALFDDTAEFVASPGSGPAWDEGLGRIRQGVPAMPTGSEVSVFTMADSLNYMPRCRVAWTKNTENGKNLISAHSRKSHSEQLTTDLNTLTATMRACPVTEQTRLLETIYEMLRSLHERTSSACDKSLIVVSDMQPSTQTLTTTGIVESEAKMQECIAQIEREYPPLGLNRVRVVIVYSPSEGLLQQSPIFIERLKTFWLAFFHHLACEVEWVSPQPTAGAPRISADPNP